MPAYLLPTLLFLLLNTHTLASPLAKRSTTLSTTTNLLALAPATASCDNAAFPSECRTAASAAPYIALSFQNFGLADDANTQAALLALILYESGDLRYAHNHYPAPGTPGQGTRNMQSAAYNLQYAQWLATACANCGFSTAAVQRASADGPDAVLALVNGDVWGFASAAWFLVTQCGAGVREGLTEGSQSGWEAFLTECVGTEATEDRTEVWTRVMALNK